MQNQAVLSEYVRVVAALREETKTKKRRREGKR